MKALRGLLRKEIHHILRDRRTLAVLVLLPVLEVVLFGYSIRTDVKDVRLAIVDPTPDATTLDIRNKLEAGGVFRTVAVVQDQRELEPLFRNDRAQEAVVFQPGFRTQLARGLPAQISLISDATEPNSGAARQAYAAAVLQAWQQDTTAARGAMKGVHIDVESRMRFNPTRESSNLFIPGLMAYVLTIISSLMTALSLARERETGTMEALLVSPLRPWQIIVGKVAPYLAIGLLSVVLILVEARLIFNVPIRGSVTLLIAEGVLFTLVSLGVGILVSARTDSQRTAMMGVLLGTMLPNVLLSGFIFPIESMPVVLQWISVLSPARWFVAISRGVMLKGIGLTYLWPETIVLAVFALLLLAVSTRSFKPRLD